MFVEIEILLCMYKRQRLYDLLSLSWKRVNWSDVCLNIRGEQKPRWFFDGVRSVIFFCSFSSFVVYPVCIMFIYLYISLLCTCNFRTQAIFKLIPWLRNICFGSFNKCVSSFFSVIGYGHFPSVILFWWELF